MTFLFRSAGVVAYMLLSGGVSPFYSGIHYILICTPFYSGSFPSSYFGGSLLLKCDLIPPIASFDTIVC